MIALDFRGQTAVVTGGLQGIGKAIAELLHRGGANVVVGDIAARAREQTLRQLVLRTDVSSREQAHQLIGAAVETFGGVDILVNSCGVSAMSTVTQMSDADWQRILDVNVKSIGYLAEAAIPLMKAKSGGRIINIASQAGKK